VIDLCFTRFRCRSFADLGGIWAVDGGYACYAADAYPAERGIVVDDDFTDEFQRRVARLPRLESMRGNFGECAMPEQVGNVDVIFAFDILLHQVDPDWNELLAMYAQQCRALAIVEPQWNGAETIRLLDLGEREYLSVVPASDGGPYEGLFSKLDTINPRRQRPWRDVHDIWQWGITDHDLIDALSGLGFDCAHHRITGPWRGSSHFHESAFVFTKRA
jgi:hypothetical protein